MITAEYLQQRRAELVKQREQLSANLTQLSANLSAFTGAIEFCDQLIAEVTPHENGLADILMRQELPEPEKS